MDVEGAAGSTLHQHLDVVHPGVVRPQVPAADQHRLGNGPADGGEQPGQVVEEAGGVELDLAALGAQDLGQARLEGAEVDTVGVLEEHVEDRVAPPGAEEAHDRRPERPRRLGVAEGERPIGGLLPATDEREASDVVELRHDEPRIDLAGDLEVRENGQGQGCHQSFHELWFHSDSVATGSL